MSARAVSQRPSLLVNIHIQGAVWGGIAGRAVRCLTRRGGRSCVCLQVGGRARHLASGTVRTRRFLAVPSGAR